MTALGLPIAAALGLLVSVSTLLHVALGLRSPSPWIIPDEILYAELARSLAGGGLPQIRGENSFAWGLGYPLLVAPIWGLLGDTATAYAVSKALGALLLSATAVPAYLLARRFVPSQPALVVAAMTVCVPSMLYAGTLLTEVALYPAFVLTLFAIAVAVECPRRRAQAAALGAIVLACTIKTLAIVLLPAYLGAVVLYHFLDTRDGTGWLARMRAYTMTWALLGAGVIASGVLALALDRHPLAPLGAYAVVASNIDFSSVPWWALLHLAELDLYLGIIPFAATVVLVFAAVGSGVSAPTTRLFVAVAVPAVGALLLAVAAYSSKANAGAFGYPSTELRLHERSMFLLAPLFFIGLALWLNDRSGRARVVAACIVGAALLPMLLPVEDFDANMQFQAVALVPWVETRDALPWRLEVLVFTTMLALVLVLAIRARVSASFIVMPVVLVLLGVGSTAHVSMREASVGARAAMGGSTPDWIDRAVGPEADVSILWAEPPGRPFVDLRRRHYVVFVGEFFNRSLGRVFELGSPMPYDLPTTRVALDDGRVVLENGRAAQLGDLVLAPCWVDVEGTPVVRDAATGATIYRVPDQVRARVSPQETCA